MTTQTDPAQVEALLDDVGRVAESLPCRGCGYDLKGIAADGVCPECARPVDRSIRGDLLEFCDPSWLDRLAQGLLLISFGVFGGVVLQFGIVLAAALTAATGASRAMTIVMVIAGLITALLSLLNVIGLWLVTVLDPGRTETESSLSARKVARVAILASLVAAPMQMSMGQGGMLTGGGGAGIRAIDVIVIVVSVTTAVLAVGGWVAFYIYLRQIVLRAPLEGLARQIRIIMWGFAISMVFSLALGATSMVLLATGRLTMTGGAGGTAATALGVSLGSCVGMIAYTTFEIWAAVVFLLLRRRLKVMVAEGRGRW